MTGFIYSLTCTPWIFTVPWAFQPCRENARIPSAGPNWGQWDLPDFVPIRHDSEKQKVYMSLVRHGIDNSAFFQRNRFGLPNVLHRKL